MKKLVSIILPVYNGAFNIASSIDSILKQTYTNWELIIINDCSTDHTLDVISKYHEKDSRIKIINNQVNLKLPKTLNVGFKEAKGDYLTWTSDDNIYKNNAIMCMVEELEQHGEIDLVYADYTDIDKDGNIIGEKKLTDSCVLSLGNGIGACFLYTRRIFEKVGYYDSDLFLAEDYDYWIQIKKVGKLKHISENLYYYRLHDGSLTITRKNEVDQQSYKVLEKNFMFLYLEALNQKKEFYFFEHMTSRLTGKEKKDLIASLILMNPKYKYFLIRKKINDGFWGKVKFKLKGLVVK